MKTTSETTVLKHSLHSFARALPVRGAVVAAAGLCLVTPTLVGAQSDDFNDGDDAGWSPIDPIRTYIFATTGADVPQNTFTVADGKYRLQAAPTPDPALGQGRVLSLREEVYSNFHIATDLIDWDPAVTNAMGLIGRAGTPGPQTTRGYVFGYVSGMNYLDLVRLQNEGTRKIADNVILPITLTPGRGYRMTLTGKGPELTGRVYELNDLNNPIAEIKVSDSNYTDGTSGLVVFPLAASVLGAGDATFDNFAATDRERPRAVIKIGDFGERLVSWPTYEGEGFTLQGASSLGAGSAWRDITDNIFPDLATDSLFFDASESNYRFFRLRKAGGAN
ncbi:MAG: hypothetical protein IPK15_11525 [Verrucomicrobia bacterium]|nr:hypothetical protein [Verrucomicrobiota bacterium]